MGNSASLRSIASKVLQWTCLITVNCLALFVILNVSIWGYSKLSELKFGNNEPEKAPMRYKTSNEALEKLFPKLTRQEIDQLIYDSRRIVQEYDSYTQFREAPYKTKFVNVDINGFRHSGNQGPWPPLKNDFVIFFFGGSTSFGYGVPDSETVASHLQEILTDKLGIPVRIYNFGRAAYFSSQERILFQKLLLDGHIPDMAIFMDGINEFALFDGEPGYTKQFKTFMQESDIPLFKRLVNELPLVKLINEYLKPARSKHLDQLSNSSMEPKKLESDLLASIIQRYQMNKRIIEAISRDFGITSVFIWQPMPLYGYNITHHIFKDFDYNRFTPYLKRGYEFVSSSSSYRQIGQNFIWLAEMQKDSNQPLYVSAFHYGPEMSRTVANSIAAGLITRNLIPANSAITPGIISMSGTEAPRLSVTGGEN